MLTKNKEELEKDLGYELSIEQFQKINNLPYISLERVRNNPTGKKFERLYVLGRAPSVHTTAGRPVSQWWCICDCPEHTLIAVRINNLTSGNSKSCGCLDKEAAKARIIEVGKKCASDLTGKRFGKLVAIKPTDERRYGSVVWECQCDCGNIYKTTSIQLSRGHCNSCGCLYESRGSFKIKQLLQEAQIPFTTEKVFQDCRFSDTNQVARFDFWVNDSFLVEFDGEQHFKEDKRGFFKDSLEKRQRHDTIKNQYCKEHNIPLKRIPYTDVSELTLNDIMGDKYLI